ncbi:hypothetical protein ABMA32_06850 [Mesorhizobium sp. VNQ89]|uniref:hypothetical protein n=1 Tax=Mesorhizobium quangtriensis TaxID=3157709 RepID=UPI0032B734D2
MLARPETRRCTECGLPYGAAGFACYHGDIDQGPAYWSDRGILCSPKCSLAHWKRRDADGSLPSVPAADPFLLDQPPFRRR